MTTRSVVAAIAMLSLSVASGYRPAAQTPRDRGGQLVVIVVADQMRADYLERYKQFWQGGFARLLKDGAIFEQAAYPYLNTVTCAGHATIGTGAFPATHGIIMNEWWQRAQGRRMSCTDDVNVKSVPYGGGKPERIGHSAHRMRIPSFGDRLRASTPGSRVVTISMKPRSTVMMAGHGSTASTWFADSNVWATSTGFSQSPVPEVQAYVTTHPVDAERGVVWNHLLDPKLYSGVDDGVGEKPARGWTPLFAHPLAGAPGTPSDQFYELWERSPFSDVAIGELSQSLVRSLHLGREGVVDYLGVSFSALDYVGHNFGPDSHEVQDTLIRLDRTLGALMAALDAEVGRDRYVLALSADHGVDAIPEALTARGQDAGRVLNVDTRRIAEAAMVAAYGPGPHVAHVEYTELYLTDTARQMVDARPAALQPLVTALSNVPGMLRVIPTRGLEQRRNSADRIERAAALSYYPGESGDALLILKPGWIGTDSSAATHGTLHEYDQRVPVIFFGKAIRPGRYREAASPADIAPTLAKIIKLSLPGVDGKALTNALR